MSATRHVGKLHNRKDICSFQYDPLVRYTENT